MDFIDLGGGRSGGSSFPPPLRAHYDIWVAVYGVPVPRDDSAEADLFRMLIRDLSIGGVIRQPRESDYGGRFLKKNEAASKGGRFDYDGIGVRRHKAICPHGTWLAIRSLHDDRTCETA